MINTGIQSKTDGMFLNKQDFLCSVFNPSAFQRENKDLLEIRKTPIILKFIKEIFKYLPNGRNVIANFNTMDNLF